MYPSTLKKALPILWANKITPLVVGFQGIGKSEIVRQYAKEHGYNLIDIRVGQMADAGELIGLANFLRNGDDIVSTKFIKPDYLPSDINGKYIIHFDEINRGAKDILQAAFQLVYDREIFLNGFKLGENMHIVCSMNPPTEDFDVLDFSDSAFVDRFCQLKLEPNVKEWLTYMRDKYDSHYLDFVENNPEMLGYSEMKSFDLSAKPSGRSIEMLAKVERYMQSENINERDLVFEIFAGFVGETKEEVEKPLTAMEVLSNFSKENQEKVKKYADLDDGRPEIIDNITTNLSDILSEKEDITKKEWDNFLSYLLLVPREHLIIRFRQLIDTISGKNKTVRENLNDYFTTPKKIQKLREKVKQSL